MRSAWHTAYGLRYKAWGSGFRFRGCLASRAGHWSYGVGEQRKGYRDAGHDGGVDGRHALHEQRVARADHVGVSPAAVVRQARPVAAVEHGKVVRRGLLQALERREKLPCPPEAQPSSALGLGAWAPRTASPQAAVWQRWAGGALGASSDRARGESVVEDGRCVAGSAPAEERHAAAPWPVKRVARGMRADRE